MTKILGLTGGIGCGKSTVAKIFADLGCMVINLDDIARQLTAKNGAALPLLFEAFGAQIMTPTGELKRDNLRTLILHDKQKKQQLEAILHPLIRQQALEQIQHHAAKNIVVEVPLLAQSREWQQIVNAVLVVDCPQEQQIRRVKKRSNLSREQVQRFIDTQASKQSMLAIADFVIVNANLTMAQLKQQVVAVYNSFFK